ILSAQLVTRGFDRETTVQVELAPVGDAGPVSTPSQRAVPEPAVDPLAAFARQVDAWTVLSQGSTPAPDLAAEVDRRQREYLATNRADAATRSLLGAMFGHAWAEEYVVTVLYPEGAPK
ncbi:MAG: hypothetical protein JWL60_814, partial [Gemmatimonadetes bacterium]|nr:hypothetical protein [Gemmatimonadota bacterium]